VHPWAAYVAESVHARLEDAVRHLTAGGSE
jgi:hypothetical protein